MAEKRFSTQIANTKAFVKDSKKTLIVVAVVVGGATIYSVTRHHAPPVNQAKVMTAPTLGGHFGDPISPNYQKNLAQADTQRLAQANKTGDSYMDTIVPQSSGESNLTPAIDDADETGGPGGKAPPTLPDAQPHLAALPPAAPAPPAGGLQPAPRRAVAVTPSHYVSPGRMTELQHLLSDRINNNEASLGSLYAYTPIVASSGGRASTSAGSATGGDSARAAPGMTGGSDASLRAAAGGGAAGGAGSAGTTSFDVPDPGTILPAHFLSLTDSRINGMVLAVIDDGPYRGARALGKFTVASGADKLMFQFTRLIVTYDDDSGESKAKVIPINAVAVDPNTLSEGMATYVNTHMLARIASTMATSFMQGLGQAIQQSGSTAAYTASGGTIISQGQKNLTQEMFQAGGQSAGQVGQLLSQMFGNMQTTIKEDQYVSFGMLFVGSNS